MSCVAGERLTPLPCLTAAPCSDAAKPRSTSSPTAGAPLGQRLPLRKNAIMSVSRPHTRRVSKHGQCCPPRACLASCRRLAAHPSNFGGGSAAGAPDGPHEAWHCDIWGQNSRRKTREMPGAGDKHTLVDGHGSRPPIKLLVHTRHDAPLLLFQRHHPLCASSDGLVLAVARHPPRPPFPSAFSTHTSAPHTTGRQSLPQVPPQHHPDGRLQRARRKPSSLGRPLPPKVACTCP